MRCRVLVAAGLAMLLSVVAAAQMPDQDLDVSIARVKPDKRADFDAVSKKMVEANRKNHGDNWIAMETVYGENNVITFVSTRSSYADAEKASDTFMGALNKAYGPAGAGKLFQEANNSVVSFNSEFRRRRWDLSYNPPADAAAYTQSVGHTRWVRTIVIHVRPGRELVFEAAIREVNAAATKNNEPGSVLISQGDAGQRGPVYYVTWLLPTLGDADKGTPLPQMLGEGGFQHFLRSVSDSVESSETVINRIVPELSNPPDAVAAVAPEFWRPKPAAAAAKPKPAGAAKPKPAENQ
jgi:hypothetical protein